MTIQEAIAIIKEYREWENSWEDINTSEFSPYTDETYREAIDTVVAELEKPTYTAQDMEDFRNWAHWNGYHFILSEKKWYNPFSEENAETRYTIDEVIKLWEEAE